MEISPQPDRTEARLCNFALSYTWNVQDESLPHAASGRQDAQCIPDTGVPKHMTRNLVPDLEHARSTTVSTISTAFLTVIRCRYM